MSESPVVYQLHQSQDFTLDVMVLQIDFVTRSPDLGRRFLEAVKQVSGLIRDFPLLGSSVPSAENRNLRIRGVPKFRSYVVLYSVEGANVTLLRLLHGARDLPSLLDE